MIRTWTRTITEIGPLTPGNVHRFIEITGGRICTPTSGPTPCVDLGEALPPPLRFAHPGDKAIEDPLFGWRVMTEVDQSQLLQNYRLEKAA